MSAHKRDEVRINGSWLTCLLRFYHECITQGLGAVFGYRSEKMRVGAQRVKKEIK